MGAVVRRGECGIDGDGAEEVQESRVSAPVDNATDALESIPVVSPRSYVCEVPSCRKAFKRREHLRRHMRSLHTNDKRE